MKLKINYIDLLFYAIAFLFNDIVDILYYQKSNIYIPFEMSMLACITYFVSLLIQNRYSKIIAHGWMLFFFLGILNINSISHQTNTWNLDIIDASYLYLVCLLVFDISLIICENYLSQNHARTKSFIDNPDRVTFSRFGYFILAFPIVMMIDIFYHLGFIPIISGKSIVEEMYVYDYGYLYGFKFVCIYGFLAALALIIIKKKNILGIAYIALLFIILSIDGKRFVLLLCLFALIPCYTYLNQIKGKKESNLLIYISFLGIILFYIAMSVIRGGGSFEGIGETIVEKIPFGIEYKDFVHSFNEYKEQIIPGYNFELSVLGSFLNSSILGVLGFDKFELVQMGSAYTWMKLYDSEYGIRTGIICELYFAYGYWVVPCMAIIAYFTHLVNARLEFPKSYFELFQNSILFALIFLLINGQATVFFGCLPMMIYVYIVFKILDKTFSTRSSIRA